MPAMGWKRAHGRYNRQRVVSLLRLTCNRCKDERGYGIEPHELGSRSIQSGAAMALFLNDHPAERIMILGRWLSDAFMVYIRPQVLEWVKIMAEDMAATKDFRDLNRRLRPHHANRRPTRNEGLIPEFHLSHSSHD